VSLNPYAAALAGREPTAVIASSAASMRELLARIGAARLQQAPAPGKWSARDIVCHLADTEIAFAFRLRQTLAEEHHVIQPFDQDRFAAVYGAMDAAVALESFAALRQWNLALLAALPTAASSRPVTHPERGTMTFASIVETMAGHDLNHLSQLEAIARSYTES
jgi:uncharacterized damage-inducible protein DinB